jgi:hypothetical protein
VLLDDAGECAKGAVHGIGVAEYSRHVRVQAHEVGACRVARGVLAADAALQAVFGQDLVVGDVLFISDL